MDGKGPLVRVEISPGRFVQMYRVDAIALGLLKPERKRRRPGGDKMLRPEGDKSMESDPKDDGEIIDDLMRTFLPDLVDRGDDLTEIPGVGPATAAVLQARGIGTFAALREADLTGLHHLTRKAIEKWREDEHFREPAE